MEPLNNVANYFPRLPPIGLLLSRHPPVRIIGRARSGGHLPRIIELLMNIEHAEACAVVQDNSVAYGARFEPAGI